MKFLACPSTRRRTIVLGFTLVELLVTVGLGTLVVAVIATLTVFGARTFASLVNYTELDQKGRNSLDVMCMEIRQTTSVISMANTATMKSLTFTNADLGQIIKFTWMSATETMVFEKTGQPARTNLTGCERWDFALYNKAPNVSATNVTFNATTDPANCKLIDMSWTCYRKIIGQKLNTESVQTAQIVLRGKK